MPSHDPWSPQWENYLGVGFSRKPKQINVIFLETINSDTGVSKGKTKKVR